MHKIGVSLYLVLLVAILTDCAKTPSRGARASKEPQAVEVKRMDVTTGDNRQAVLSLHKRYAYKNARVFGLTLTKSAAVQNRQHCISLYRICQR